jgi:hypothetical protein
VDYSAVFNASLEEVPEQYSSEYEYQYGEYAPEYGEEYQYQAYPAGYYYDEYGNEYYYSGEYASDATAESGNNTNAQVASTQPSAQTASTQVTSTPASTQPSTASPHDSFELADTARFTSATDFTDVFHSSEPQPSGAQFMDDNDPMLSTMNFMNLQSEIDKMLGDISTAFVPSNPN